jgi:hypothetical protein
VAPSRLHATTARVQLGGHFLNGAIDKGTRVSGALPTIWWGVGDFYGKGLRRAGVRALMPQPIHAVAKGVGHEPDGRDRRHVQRHNGYVHRGLDLRNQDHRTPTGATTGKLKVVTLSRTLTSKVSLRVYQEAGNLLVSRRGPPLQDATARTKPHGGSLWAVGFSFAFPRIRAALQRRKDVTRRLA